MADNYLEKKYDEFVHGKPVYLKSSPSVETLLRKVAAGEGLQPEPASGALSSVKMAQLKAIARVAAVCVPPGDNFSFEPAEGAVASISVLGPSSPDRCRISLGRALLAMELKAAELGLCARACVPAESLRGSRFLARLDVWKKD